MALNPSNKIVHGARVLISVGGRLIGIIYNCSWQMAYDTADAYIVGRLSVAEIAYTAQEPISGSLAIWKIVDAGAHAALGLPQLQDLLTADYTTITLQDRMTGKDIGRIIGVRLLGVSGGIAARQMSEGSVPFKAMLLKDETADNEEPAGSPDLP